MANSCDNMQVVYEEMSCCKMESDWWIGGFKFVKNCMFIYYNDWVCSDWTLGIVLRYVMDKVRCG